MICHYFNCNITKSSKLLYYICLLMSESEISSNSWCEITSCRNCEIESQRFLWNEIRHKHLRSKYFTENLFHIALPYFTCQKAYFVEKTVDSIRIYRFFWSWWRESNSWPLHYQCSALPTELHQHNNSYYTPKQSFCQ